MGKQARERMARMDAQYRATLGVSQGQDLRDHFRSNAAPRPRVELAGPVTVTRIDGTSSTLPPLTQAELNALVKDREPISKGLRQFIYRRDRGLCRYCGSSGPHQIDHVLPVALGGRSVKHNLVLACIDCNRRKAANVWRPKPVGFFLSAQRRT